MCILLSLETANWIRVTKLLKQRKKKRIWPLETPWPPTLASTGAALRSSGPGLVSANAELGASAVVLLLIATVELAQLLLAHPPGFVGLGGAAGARGLGRLGTVAARRCPLEEVLRDAALQVLHGRRRRHADDPGMLEGLASRQTLAGLHRQDPLHKVFGQVGHTGPRLGETGRHRKYSYSFFKLNVIFLN